MPTDERCSTSLSQVVKKLGSTFKVWLVVLARVRLRGNKYKHTESVVVMRGTEVPGPFCAV